MGAYFSLGSLEADLERVHSYECDLLGSLLRKAGRRLGKQDRKGSKPSKDMIVNKISGGQLTQSCRRALETPQATPWRCPDQGRGAGITIIPHSLGTGLRAAPGETEISRHFYLCCGA